MNLLFRDWSTSSPLTLTTTRISSTFFAMKTPDHYATIRNDILSDKRALDAIADGTADKELLDTISRYLESELALVNLAYETSTQEHAPSLDAAISTSLR